MASERFIASPFSGFVALGYEDRSGQSSAKIMDKYRGVTWRLESNLGALLFSFWVLLGHRLLEVVALFLALYIGIS